MVKRILVAAALVAATLAQMPAAARSPAPATTAAVRIPFKISFPAAGAVVNNGSLVIAELGQSFPRSKVKEVRFEASPNGRDSWRRFSGAAPPGPLEFAAVWYANTIAGGDYFLRARLVRRGDPPVLSRPVRVIVNRQPSALITGVATGVEPRLGAVARRIALTFDSHARDTDGTITSIEWDLGDGTTASGPEVSHSYPPGEYKVSVTTKDDKGGVFVSRHTLTITDDGEGVGFVLHKVEECGCKGMQVNASGRIPDDSKVGFATADHGFADPSEEKALGPYLGDSAGDTRALCRFEIVAEITGDPALCAEGMRFQLTRTIDGLRIPAYGTSSSDPRYDSSKGPDDPYTTGDRPTGIDEAGCGFGSRGWCDGGLHGGGSPDGKGSRGKQPPDDGSKEYGQGLIRMVAAGGLHRSWTGAGTSRSHTLTLELAFEVVVSGADGSCRCTGKSFITLQGVPGQMQVIRNEVTDVQCQVS